MKIKVSEATNIQLDWLVAKALPAPANTLELLDRDIYNGFSPTTNWAQGGPIMDREHIGVDFQGWGEWVAWDDKTIPAPRYIGPTPLVAAMRCYVASKIGDTVEIPKELT